MGIDFLLYYILLATTTVVCWLQVKWLDKADKMIGVLLIITSIEEPLSLVFTRVYHNNFVVYHLYSPVEFFLISLYFNYSITLFRKHNIGLIAGVAGVVFSVLSTIFLQPIKEINSIFLMFEGVMIIMYCLISFHQILLDELHLPYGFAHFWISVCLIIYWGLTFTGWGMYATTDPYRLSVNNMFIWLLEASNYFFYFGIGLVFLLYKRLIPSGTHA